MAELFSHDFKNAFPYWIIWEGRMQRKKCSTVQLQNSKLLTFNNCLIKEVNCERMYVIYFLEGFTREQCI